MATLQAPNLHTTTHVVPDEQYILFPANKHRTKWFLQVADSTTLYVWIGSTTPSANVTGTWLSTEGDLPFAEGIYGPIWIAEVGAGDGVITVVSSIVEVPEFPVAIDSLPA